MSAYLFPVPCLLSDIFMPAPPRVQVNMPLLSHSPLHDLAGSYLSNMPRIEVQKIDLRFAESCCV
jgi:hypothetical protein